MLLHSLNIDIRSSSLDAAGAAAKLYASNDLTRVLPFPAKLSIRLEREGSREAIPLLDRNTPNAVFSEINLCGGMCHYRDGIFFSVCDNPFRLATEFDVRNDTLDIVAGGRYSELDDLAVTSLVLRQVMQSFVLPFYRLKSLHGAVISFEGRTILLRGAGGAGKTTTALRLCADGAGILSDDSPVFTLVDGQAAVLSSLDCCHVTEETLRLLPRLQSQVLSGPDIRGKFTLRRQTPERVPHVPLRVTHIVDLRRGDYGVPTVTSAEAHDGTAQLIDESMIVFRAPAFDSLREVFSAHTRFVFEIVTSLTRNAEMVRLRYADRHLDDLPGLLRAL